MRREKEPEECGAWRRWERKGVGHLRDEEREKNECVARKRVCVYIRGCLIYAISVRHVQVVLRTHVLTPWMWRGRPFYRQGKSRNRPSRFPQ